MEETRCSFALCLCIIIQALFFGECSIMSRMFIVVPRRDYCLKFLLSSMRLIVGDFFDVVPDIFFAIILHSLN